jgi:membrane-bound metal-dependent hydrolase YbcI (DUF457 family)
MALAIAPDVDYLAVWLFDYAANPRFTHSVSFALALVTIVHRMKSRGATANFSFRWLLFAGVSHAFLDLLVGAHPVPLFWPVDGGISLPVGVLPSAGSFAPGNVYLWRNLFIELGVLAPAFALLVAVSRRRPVRRLVHWVLLIAPVWAVFVMWSMALSR